MLFGGTGAGLAGYKMIKRTRGLTDFEFQSFDAKVSCSAAHCLDYCYIPKYQLVSRTSLHYRTVLR